MVTNELGEAVKNYHVEVLSELGTPEAPAGQAEAALGPGTWVALDTPGAFTWAVSSDGCQAARAHSVIIGLSTPGGENQLGLGPHGHPNPYQSWFPSATCTVVPSEAPQLESWYPQKIPQRPPQ